MPEYNETIKHIDVRGYPQDRTKRTTEIELLIRTKEDKVYSYDLEREKLTKLVEFLIWVNQGLENDLDLTQVMSRFIDYEDNSS